MTISVVGGSYYESCIAPELNQFYGSGGRAAAALSGEDDIEFHTYVSDEAASDVKHLADRFRIRVRRRKAHHCVRFEYDHGLSPPNIYPAVAEIAPNRSIIADGDVVLVFGMLEGTARVRGDSVVYDPQSELAPAGFHETGSKARRLAIVANSAEVAKLTGISDLHSGARALMKSEHAQAVFVKLGAAGVLVGEAGRWRRTPAYFSERIVPIGSGDVFSAAITLYWGKRDMSAVAAAGLASRCVADYVERRALPMLNLGGLRSRSSLPVKEVAGTAYLAGPFFSVQQRRLVEEVLGILESTKLKVISPLRDIGRGPSDYVARADLAALRKCDRVFAILEGNDPGTLFEVGYARARRIPVFAYAETLSEESLTMFTGSGCHVFADIPTTIYRTIWKR
jgi:sugar/nucleoside kinase (ribokinase family)